MIRMFYLFSWSSFDLFDLLEERLDRMDWYDLSDPESISFYHKNDLTSTSTSSITSYST
jgi:hypothetical protein